MKCCAACEQAIGSDGWRCTRCGFAPSEHDGVLCFAEALAAANDGFEAERFAELAALEERNFWFRSRNRLIAWALERYFPTPRNLLEIGCGTGFVLRGLHQRFPTLALCGSEIHTAGLGFARTRCPGALLFQMDARHIPYADEFDVVAAFDVIEHIDDDVRVLAQMHRATRRGGGILLSVPQHRFLWSAFDEAACHKRRYSRTELAGKVSHAGFDVQYVGSYCSVLLPLMLLSRMRSRKQTATYDPLRELRVSGLLNWTLERVLSFERSLIRAGVRFPAGGSLLLIAKKP